MSEAIRNYPWRITPVGPIESWPPELILSVNSMLTSRQIACLIWGETEQVLLYNDLYAPLLGNKDPALGENFLDVWSEIREQAAAIIAQPFQTQEANLFERVPFFILVNGELVERICSLTNNPIWSLSEPEPKILGLYQTIVDYTEGELAIRRVREESERLTQIMAASRDAVTLVDKHWHITYMNAATLRIIGPASDFLGKNLWECFPEIKNPDSPCLLHFPRAMNEGIPTTFETHYPAPYNLPIMVDVCPTSEGIVTFVRDISKEKKAEAALIQNEKLAAVGRLAASIAHEINNPLESVTNLLYLARTTQNPAELENYLAIAERELRRVSVISNQTLRFHKQSSNPRSVTDQELFESVLSIYQGRLINSHVHVEKRFRATNSIRCYDGEIRQVLNNLVGNAKEVIDRHHGNMTVRSVQRPGATGTVFTVFLPLEAATR